MKTALVYLAFSLSRRGNAKSSEKLKSERNSFEISGVGFSSDTSNKSSDSIFFLAIITLYSQEHWLRNSKKTTIYSLTDFNFSEILRWPSHRRLEGPAGPVSKEERWLISLEKGACSERAGCPEAPASCLRSGPALCHIPWPRPSSFDGCFGCTRGPASS